MNIFSLSLQSQSPLHKAVSFKRTEVVLVLLKYHANVNIKDEVCR